MPRPSSNHRAQDMYWFAHGGIDAPDHANRDTRENTPNAIETEEDTSESNSLTVKQDRIVTAPEEIVVAAVKNTDCQSSVSKGGTSTKRLAVEERKRQIQEAEQEKNEAILKKHADRDAALEARRNAQRNNLSFAFGTAVLPNMEFDILPVQIQHHEPSTRPPKLAVDLMSQSMISTSMMSQSMTASMISNGARGRRKNDLTPTVPYERTPTSRSVTSATRKRSVSMSRLDQLALPRKSYVEAQKAGSTLSNASSTRKEQLNSPKRPLSSASEKSHKSPRTPPSAAPVVHRRPQTATRKPRPVSIAGSVPDPKPTPPPKNTAQRRSMVQAKKPETPKVESEVKSKTPSSASNRHAKAETVKKEEVKKSSPVASAKGSAAKLAAKQVTPKSSPARKLLTNKKKAAMLGAMAKDSASDTSTEAAKSCELPVHSSFDEDSLSADEKSSSKQHIVSEEEAKVALAEKRRLAREQAEKEAELERQRQEQLQREEELQRQKEEEEQRRMEEEQLRLLEEHKKFEEEKLQKAIQEQERKEEEEKHKKDEDARLKAEQEKKAKEEAEKQRIELEEKLRKEEEERAERKKRLEKIMSRTRGKSGTASPSGSLNGSDPPDSLDNHPLSSDPSSLESNEQFQAVEQSSPTESFDVNQTLLLVSQSLSSNDLMIPSSQHTSLDGSVQVFASEPTSLEDCQQKEMSNEVEFIKIQEGVTSEGGSSVIIEHQQQEVIRQEVSHETQSVPTESEINQEMLFQNSGNISEEINVVQMPAVDHIQPIATGQEETVDHLMFEQNNTQNEILLPNPDPEILIGTTGEYGVPEMGQTLDSYYVQSTDQNEFFVPDSFSAQSEHYTQSDMVSDKNQFNTNQTQDFFAGNDSTMQIPPPAFNAPLETDVTDGDVIVQVAKPDLDEFSHSFASKCIVEETGSIGVEIETVVSNTQSEENYVPTNTALGHNNPFGDCNPSENWPKMDNPFQIDNTANHVNQGLNYAEDNSLPLTGELQNQISHNIFSNDSTIGFNPDPGMGFSSFDSINSTGESAVFEVTSDFNTNTMPGFNNFVPKFCDQTFNPFSNNKLNSAIDFIAEESEESSLDSNLSQVLNVNTSDVAACEKTVPLCDEDSLINGLSHSMHLESKESAFCDKDKVPKSNGCNGSSLEDRTNSEKKSAEQVSSSSGKLQLLPDNGNVESRDIFCLDNGDLTNSNKIAPNPFLGSSEANPFSTNLF